MRKVEIIIEMREARESVMREVRMAHGVMRLTLRIHKGGHRRLKICVLLCMFAEVRFC